MEDFREELFRQNTDFTDDLDFEDELRDEYSD